MKIPSEPKCTFLRCITCGAELIVRRRRDDNKPFLGCKNYPTCKGAWDMHQAVSYGRTAGRWEASADEASLILLDANLFYSYYENPKQHALLLNKVTELISRYTAGPQQARPKPSGGKTVIFVGEDT